MVAIAGRGWKLAPSLRAMFDEADKRWPSRSFASDGSIGDQAHAARASDHNPSDGWVCAGDLTDDKANGCDADLFAEHLRKSRDQRVKYVICNGRMFSSYGTSSRKAWEWGKYTGANAHDKHTHVSIHNTAAARDDLSSWFPYADAPLPKPAPVDEEDEPMLYLFRHKDHAEVWITDLITKRHVKGLAGVQHWARKGKVWNDGKVEVVDDIGFLDEIPTIS